MKEKNRDVEISSIDRAKNTVELCVDGCPVTVICDSKPNPEAYDKVKSCLIGAVVLRGENLAKI